MNFKNFIQSFKKIDADLMRSCYIQNNGYTYKAPWLRYTRGEHRRLKKQMKQLVRLYPSRYVEAWIEYADKIKPEQNPQTGRPAPNSGQSRSFHQQKPSA